MNEKKLYQFSVLLGLFVSILISCANPSNSENDSVAPDILWEKTFGGEGTDQAISIQQTNDGGYIVLGSTDSKGNGGMDAWLVKLDENGNETWNKTFGGTENDGPISMQQTSDNGYIFVGITYSFGNGEGDSWMVKTDENGNKLWDKTFGGPALDCAQSVIQISGGGFVITGGTFSFGDSGDIWLIKTDKNGKEIWNRTFGGAGDQKAYRVRQTPDGGYIMAGFTDPTSNLAFDILLLKVDGNGNEIWRKIFGGSNTENAYSCQLTSDGGCLLAGYTKSFGNGQEDIWLIKTDSSGNEEWNKTFGGSGRDNTYSAQQTADGGYVIGGFTDSKGNGGFDFWIIKTDQQGNQIWDRTCGTSSDEHAFFIQQTSAGGYIIAGETNSSGNGKTDFYVVLLDSD